MSYFPDELSMANKIRRFVSGSKRVEGMEIAYFNNNYLTAKDM